MSYKKYHIENMAPAITRKVFNNSGLHNEFVMILDTENHYPGKIDPVILRYDVYIKKWRYVADKTVSDFSYVREVINVKGGKFVLKHLPLNGIVWDVSIHTEKDEDIDIDPKTLTIRNNVVYCGEGHGDGLVDIMYCIGTITSDDGEKLENVLKRTNSVASSLKLGTGITDADIEEMEKEEVVSNGNDIKKKKYEVGEITTEIALPKPVKKLKPEEIIEHIDIISEKMTNIRDTEIRTIKRTKIHNGKVRLPSLPRGDAIHNMAHIFNSTDTKNDLFLREASCKIVGRYVRFDNSDEVEGLYAVVSYLTDI